MRITNDSPNLRTDVFFYYIEFSHPGHDHDWLAPTGVGGCKLGTMDPGSSATCHSPWHSSKSPDKKPECNPVSDYNFRFMISYKENDNNRNSPQTDASITSVTGASGTVNGFKWDSHIEQLFLDEPCSLAPPPVQDPPRVALDDNNKRVILPGWFKNNAIWWIDGKITDIEIINAIENLISLGIIPLETFAVLGSDEESLIKVAEERTIPNYIKDLFGWWANGLVPDSDIANALGFLISVGIINTGNIQNEIKETNEGQNNFAFPSDVDPNLVSEFIKNAYVGNKWNELTTLWLLEIKNAENIVFDEAADKTWKEYSKNQNKNLMQKATDYEEEEKKSKEQALDALDILYEINDLENDIIEIAQYNDISKSELENESRTPQDQIDDQVKKLGNSDEIKNGYNEAKMANNQAEIYIITGDVQPKGAVIDLVDAQTDIFKKIGEILYDEPTLPLNEPTQSILTGYITGSIDIQPVDDEWNSGEEIPVVIDDFDLNKNNSEDESLDLFNPDVEHIPTLQTGSPITLKKITHATLDGNTIFPPYSYHERVEQYSDRVFLETPPDGITLEDGAELKIHLDISFEDFYDSVPEPGEDGFNGVNLINYDLRSIFNNANIDSVDIFLGNNTGIPEVLLVNNGFSQGLLDLDPAGSGFYDFGNDTATIIFNFDVGGTSTTIPGNTVMPIVTDFFSFGFFDDGSDSFARVANQIIRIELEESGDNTGLFEGSLEYTMLNQLNILDDETYEDLNTIADDPSFIVIEDLTDDDAPRVNYLEIIDDGVRTTRADQEEAPSHSGIVSFDLDTYKVADTVYITLEDQDLNVDNDLIEIYTTVNDPEDPAFGTVGQPGLPELSFGPLGRLLDVTFDDVQWKSPQGTCDLSGIVGTGLDDVTFSLVEIERDSGSFIGSFEIPDRWCRADDGNSETTMGLDIEVNYLDFIDASGNIIKIQSDSAEIKESSDLPSGDSDSAVSDPLVEITVYIFNGKEYPVGQFTNWRWPGECDNAWHVHTPTGHAVNMELSGMGDPDPNNCGWGKTSELTKKTISVPQSKLEAFEQLTGIDPTIKDPKLGGDGFS